MTWGSTACGSRHPSEILRALIGLGWAKILWLPFVLAYSHRLDQRQHLAGYGQPIEPHFGNMNDFKPWLLLPMSKASESLSTSWQIRPHRRALYQSHKNDQDHGFTGITQCWPGYVCGWEKPIECWFASICLTLTIAIQTSWTGDGPCYLADSGNQHRFQADA